MRYFGTDGIRGVSGRTPIEGDFFRRLGFTFARWLKQKNHPIRGAVGWDTRKSGPDLAQAFVDGFTSGEGQIDVLGILPTPGVSYYVREQSLSLGAVVTASHNPSHENGIKFFDGRGAKLSAQKEEEVEKILASTEGRFHSKTRPQNMKTVDGAAFYCQHIRSLTAPFLSGEKIVWDGANGAAYRTSATMLSEWGTETVAIGHQPDGNNINSQCGSEFPGPMVDCQRENRALLGFAQDGDGDRIRVSDNGFTLLNGDIVLGLLAIRLQREGRLSGNTLVVTHQSNGGLEESLKEHHIKVVRCDVGDREVFSTMEACGAALGGENSGHIIFRPYGCTGDGLMAAYELLKLHKNCPLSRQQNKILLFPTEEYALPVSQKKPLENLTHLRERCEFLRAHQFRSRGRILIRYSGTESKLRFLVEGPDPSTNKTGLNALVRAAQEDLKIF